MSNYGRLEDLVQPREAPLEVEMESEMLAQEENVTKVKFIYREQVVQIIEGENGRKGELAIITRDSDISAFNIQATVKKLADTGT